MTHKQKIRAKILYTNDILTPLERRRKVLAMAKSLTSEKIREVQELIETGATRKEIAEKAGVGLATVDRIKASQLTAEGKPTTPPKAAKQAEPQTYAAPETAQGQISARELDALRALIGQAVKAFAGIECATPADSYNLGQTYGLLMAAQMILEGNDE